MLLSFLAWHMKADRVLNKIFQLRCIGSRKLQKMEMKMRLADITTYMIKAIEQQPRLMAERPLQ